MWYFITVISRALIRLYLQVERTDSNSNTKPSPLQRKNTSLPTVEGGRQKRKFKSLLSVPEVVLDVERVQVRTSRKEGI